jgi:hypothetical protein
MSLSRKDNETSESLYGSDVIWGVLGVEGMVFEGGGVLENLHRCHGTRNDKTVLKAFLCDDNSRQA